MATASTLSTPLKSHHGLFSTKPAGGRIPLPPPRQRTTSLSNVSATSSPSTPLRREQSIHKPDPTFFSKSISRSVSKFAYANSPKSNIAKSRQSPKGLELG